MGEEQNQHGNWGRIRQIAERLQSTHMDRVYVAKEYTKGDLYRDLMSTIPALPAAEPKSSTQLTKAIK